MKKYIVLTVLSLLMTASYAQIDRSKQPQPGPAPEINLKEPARFELSNGLKVLVVEALALAIVRIRRCQRRPQPPHR